MTWLFIASAFFLSFTPLWICVAAIEARSLYSNSSAVWTEIVALVVLGITAIFSIFVLNIELNSKSRENKKQYTVNSAEKDTVSTAAFLLSNVLPLLAFDFTKWFETAQFLVIFIFLAVLCFMHHRFDSNIVMEILGYRTYRCSLISADKVKKDNIILLIRKKSLNRNDQIDARRMNDELHIGVFLN